MKYYIKRTHAIAAIKIDFSNAEQTWKTMQSLDRCPHILIHSYGQKGYSIKLENTNEEFGHGDYICYNIETGKWFGMNSYNFEYDWEEIK